MGIQPVLTEGKSYVMPFPDLNSLVTRTVTGVQFRSFYKAVPDHNIRHCPSWYHCPWSVRGKVSVSVQIRQAVFFSRRSTTLSP